MSAAENKRPLGINLLVAFFFFGLTMSALTVILVLWPGTPLDAIWRIKPTAKSELAQLGFFTAPLMTMVASACGAAAVGLAKRAEWGRRTAIAVLIVNLVGDGANAFLRADWSTLIGLPIAGLMISYLMSRRIRRWFIVPGL